MVNNRRRKKRKKRIRRIVACGLTLVALSFIGLNIVLGVNLVKVNSKKSDLELEVVKLEGNLTDCKVIQTNLGLTIQQLTEENDEYKTLNSNLESSLRGVLSELEDRQGYDDYCIDILARTIHSESCDQCLEGKYAVGCVIRNRKEAECYPDTYEEVIFQKSQFSGTQAENFNEEIDDECREIAKAIYYKEDTYSLPSTVYHFKTLECEADWGLKEYTTIEDHIFYWE